MKAIRPKSVEDTERRRLHERFHAIYEEALGYVWNTLRRLGVPERHLEDVTHDVFVVVFRKLGDFDDSLPLRPWLFGIAFNTASDFRRKAVHRREILSTVPMAPVGEADDQGSSLDEEVFTREIQTMALKVLHGIEPERAAVLILHDIDGYSIPEVARSLGIPLNTAYSRLRLARRDFRAASDLLEKGPQA